MKKLTLEIAELKVESFQVAEEDARSGTVRGHDHTFWGETCTLCGTGPCDECGPPWTLECPEEFPTDPPHC